MSPIGLTLFACASLSGSRPGVWSDQEVMIALGSTLAFTLPVWWAVSEYAARGCRTRITDLERRLAESHRSLAEAYGLEEKLRRAVEERDAAKAAHLTIRESRCDGPRDALSSP